MEVVEEEEEGEGDAVEAVEMEVKEVVAMKLVALGEDEDDVSYYDSQLNMPSFSVLIHAPRLDAGTLCLWLRTFLLRGRCVLLQARVYSLFHNPALQ